MAVKSKPKAKAKVVATPKSKAKKVVAKPKAKAVAKAKPATKAKSKVSAKPAAKKAIAKAKPVAKKAVAKAKPKAKAVAKAKPKASVKPIAKKAVAKAKPVAKKAVAKAKPKVTVAPVAKAPAKTATKVKTSSVKSQAPVQPKAAPKPKVKVEVQKIDYRPMSGSGGPIDFTPYNVERNEDYMNPHQVDHFRKILRGWLEQLREEVDATMAHMQEDMGTYPDPADRAAQEEEFGLLLRERDRERKLIKKIEQALDDLDHNDYGYCKDCGAEIGIRRLEARPTADKCIDCKTFEEIKEKQTGS